MDEDDDHKAQELALLEVLEDLAKRGRSRDRHDNANWTGEVRKNDRPKGAQRR